MVVGYTCEANNNSPPSSSVLGCLCVFFQHAPLSVFFFLAVLLLWGGPGRGFASWSFCSSGRVDTEGYRRSVQVVDRVVCVCVCVSSPTYSSIELKMWEPPPPR
jgi:hypothetical protein